MKPAIYFILIVNALNAVLALPAGAASVPASASKPAPLKPAGASNSKESPLVANKAINPAPDAPTKKKGLIQCLRDLCKPAPNNAPKKKEVDKALGPVERDPRKVAEIPKTPNKVAVRNEDGKVFGFDTKKDHLGNGKFGAVYKATDYSNQKPDTNVAMKVQYQKPGTSLEQHHQNTIREGYFNERAGLSAGKPVTKTNNYGGGESYIPMKKVEGNTLAKELQKEGNDKTKIPSKVLLANSRAEVNRVNNQLGILHNDMHPENILATKNKSTAVDYGSAHDMRMVPPEYKNNDMKKLNGNLEAMRAGRSEFGSIPLSRQKSFDAAYKDHLKIVGNN